VTAAQRSKENVLRVRSARELDQPELVVAFKCECRNDFCAEPVVLTLDEYDGVHAHPGAAVVTTDHAAIDGRAVARRTERYVVVTGPERDAV
jgi:hypothetical protein